MIENAINEIVNPLIFDWAFFVIKNFGTWCAILHSLVNILAGIVFFFRFHINRCIRISIFLPSSLPSPSGEGFIRAVIFATIDRQQ